MLRFKENIFALLCCADNTAVSQIETNFIKSSRSKFSKPWLKNIKQH